MECLSFSFPVIGLTWLQRWIGLAIAGRRLRYCSIGAAMLLGSGSASFAQQDAAQPGSALAPADRIASVVDAASQRFEIPAAWIRAVMQVESRGVVHAVSPAGAMGLMQIMPGTWAELRPRYGLGLDPFDPSDNIVAGTAYLRELLDRFGERGFLAAYNVGPSRYEEHLATGKPLPPETLAYMSTITSMRDSVPSVDDGRASSWTAAALFVAAGHAGSAPFRPSSGEDVEAHRTAATVQTAAVHTPHADGLFAGRFDRKAQQ
jgi:soluble lytic murein transglycosylase-like protein